MSRKLQKSTQINQLGILRFWGLLCHLQDKTIKKLDRLLQAHVFQRPDYADLYKEYLVSMVTKVVVGRGNCTNFAEILLTKT